LFQRYWLSKSEYIFLDPSVFTSVERYYCTEMAQRHCLFVTVTRIRPSVISAGKVTVIPGLQLSAMPWRCVGKWTYISTILNLDTRCSWVASFTLLPLDSRSNSTRCPLDRRLGGPQNWSRYYGEGKNFLAFPGIEPRLLGLAAYNLVSIST
jgi:hypothetical protein